MANEFNNALKSAAETIAKYIDSIATMTVETRFVDVNQPVNFDQAQPVARTEIRIDGDCSAVLPVRRNEAGVLVVDNDMFDMHQRNVSVAIEYRARMMDAMLGTLKQAIQERQNPPKI